MSDDSMSASELRKRYGPGGSAADSELSASQLRARHGVDDKSFKHEGMWKIQLAPIVPRW
jgi:hypothetical protein